MEPEGSIVDCGASGVQLELLGDAGVEVFHLGVVADLDANALQVLELLVVLKHGLLPADEPLLAPDLLLHVLSYLLFQHCLQDGVAGALVHLQHIVRDDGLHRALGKVVDE